MSRTCTAAVLLLCCCCNSAALDIQPLRFRTTTDGHCLTVLHDGIAFYRGGRTCGEKTTKKQKPGQHSSLSHLLRLQAGRSRASQLMYRAVILGLGLTPLPNNAVGGPWRCAGTRYVGDWAMKIFARGKIAMTCRLTCLLLSIYAAKACVLNFWVVELVLMHPTSTYASRCCLCRPVAVSVRCRCGRQIGGRKKS